CARGPPVPATMQTEPYFEFW
nr:immunoglobulin heavy chain junction region [Macaca mulatta]MOY19626.1 immunoglobulin heavy chain junction region [Macaca mulatta]MOY19958.1 immunoglobulin heavy chain junction region [Macaca mulatta]MOY20467.1 immunoglobulin heavy chain junction region [Macaca mulatta]MOY20619.1 immunoglobulin heavy chain junction region [Macaca mulatta]